MINVKDIKNLPRYSIYVIHFKLYCWANQHVSLLFKKRDIERSETSAKPWPGKAGGKIMASASLYWCLGAVLPVGSRGRGKAPSGGFRGALPSEADEILAIKTVSLH